jgi:membrane protease subunit HflK
MVRISQPGLRYRLPTPIENEIIRNVAVLNKIDGGLKNDSVRSSSEAQEQNLILTGDENMVHTNYTVLWKIKDVAEFIFTMRDPESTIRVAAESSIREVLGQTTARLALTQGRETIGTKSQELLQKILDTYKAGVQIVSVQLQRVEPPVQVVQAFNDMQASLVDADRLRNEAEAYRNDKIPRARGKATEIVKAAEAYQQQVIAQAKGEVSRFKAIVAAYRLNPEIAVRRHYLETMEKVLTQASKTIVGAGISGAKGNSVVPYINLHPPKKEVLAEAKAASPDANEISNPNSSAVNTRKG